MSSRTDADCDTPLASGPGMAWACVAQVLGAVLLAGVVFGLFHNSTQHIDELYHVLAAESYLADGDLQIGEVGEPYSRARGYTYAVAASFAVFGEGMWQSRVPSFVAGLLLAGVLFGWSRWRFGPLAAWLGLGLMLQMPLMVYASELCRFYMVQTAMAAVLLAGVDVAIDPSVRRHWRLLGALLASGAAGVAIHVQISSVFPIGLALGGAALYVCWRRTERRWPDPRRRAMILGALVVVGGLLFAAGVVWLGPLHAEWVRYRFSVPWAAESGNDTLYYVDYLWHWHRWLVLLWVPAAVLACLRWRWRGAWVATFFLVGLVVHSYGGMKAPRYLLWALPYFALTLGLGASALAGWVAQRLAGSDARPSPKIRLAVSAGVVVVLAGVVYKTVGPHQVTRMWGGVHHAYHYSDWRSARQVLEADSAWDGGVIVGSADVKALHDLGRCDYSLSQTRTEGRGEFEIDWRTGVPVVYTVAGVEQIVSQHAAGLVVIEAGHWRREWGVSASLADWLDVHLEPIEVDPVWQVLVFRWDRRGGERADAEQGPP